MALMVPLVSAWSRFTMNSCPSLEINLTYLGTRYKWGGLENKETHMASGPSHPPNPLSLVSMLESVADILNISERKIKK